MAEFRMPTLGATMESGTLVEWKVAPGDHVERGDIVAVVDTEKAAIEIEIFESGVIGQIFVPEGTKVPVGTVLATVGAEGELPAVSAPPPPSPPVVPTRERRLRISPAARKHARELGVDPSAITGTGPGGAITLQDIDAAAAAAAPAKPASRREQVMASMGAAMARSKREIPHYYLASAIDMGAAQTWLRAQNEQRSVTSRLIMPALLYKAVALALREAPELNGTFVQGAFRPGPAIHLGIAVSLRGGGTIAPVLRDADHQTLDELMAELSELVRGARAGTLRSSQMSDATITITNLGEGGADEVFGVIHPPQVALVGFGAVVDRPWVVDGQLCVRPIVSATLSADHRASDGRRGARFLDLLAARLARPETL